MDHSCERLRIALIAASLAQGGAEKQFVYAARALREQQVDVRIYSLNRGEFYEDALQEIGLNPIWFGQFSNPLVRLAKLIHELRAFKPHIIQSSHLFANLYVALAGRLTGAISIGAIRSSLKYSRVVNGAWTNWLLRTPNAVLTNSQTTWTEVDESGVISDGCVHLIPNVIESFDILDDPSRETKGMREGPTAIFLGRLIPVKRIDQFLKALALARRLAPTLKGIVVGDGPERARAERLAMELGLADGGVTFLGRRKDARSLLAVADLLVLTSDDEGFPNVLLEAMAAGLPVVTTPAGDARFVVDNEITGYVIAFGDVSEMAKRMTQLAKSPVMRSQMGESGRRRVEQVYGYESLGSRLLSVYRECAQREKCGAVLRILVPGPERVVTSRA